jgi:hypothetical protein
LAVAASRFVAFPQQILEMHIDVPDGVVTDDNSWPSSLAEARQRERGVMVVIKGGLREVRTAVGKMRN